MSSWYSTMFPRSMVRVVAGGCCAEATLQAATRGIANITTLAAFRIIFPPCSRVSKFLIVRTDGYWSPVVLRKTKALEFLVVQGRRIPQNRDRDRLSELDPLHS